ncbi:MAG TPA: bifunctional diaminohydroxyphosphoribosylaminopyrimidine deaminase/5-amino-6-(5-phosphoribosylamino)uracil reductase RibD [Acidimicrobiaceae bacterium]|nr:bifunctional diaminohydroxyphosphoribosylaminopyrimidine deaminase/5-amino-6-(5-phosphoribosylamino)uracil reductase RibD [Acidimicrobiaceae bacterium]
MSFSTVDHGMMARALRLAERGMWTTSPNPRVGCVLVRDGEIVGEGWHERAGAPHAEANALRAAGELAGGATAYVTLEPCSHHGRTPPCVDAIIEAGVAEVHVAVGDPDAKVAGRGLAALRAAGITVHTGLLADDVAEQLTPYLHHRRTGRPYVVLKLAATLDGRTAAPDGTSQWITSAAARADVHRLRAESTAILVGAGTVRADNPSLTVRDVDGPSPRRVVLGRAAEGARVHPCTEYSGPLPHLLDQLGAEGVLQLMVEGGASVAADFHRQRLVDRYVVYLAPALMGGDDGLPLFRGPGSPTMRDLWRGRIVSVRQIGPDLRIDLVP